MKVTLNPTSTGKLFLGRQSLAAQCSPLINNDISRSSITSIKTPKKKRDDLQCWRTVAIFGVVVFHVWPTWFPNGFVGVDIFFVLSGFLMATIIHKHNSKVDLEISKDFYFRRVKRIVPVYVFVLLIVIFLLFLSLWEEEFENVKKDAYWALGFVSNEQDLFEHRDYFDTQNNFRYFKHCWSLAVEMQFYLIVPVLFMLWLNFWASGRHFTLMFIFISSLTFQIISESEIMRYESMFSRIWQFTIGIAAESYKLDFVNFSSILHNIFVQIIFFFCFVLEFFPIALDREIVSILCVISSGFLITVSSSGKNSPFNVYLMNDMVKKALVYCGDFSYILYLVHWPLITYCRFVRNVTEFSFFEGIVVILACFMLAIIAHHLIENPLIKYCDSFKRLCTVTLLLYFFTSLLRMSHHPTVLTGSPEKFVSTISSITSNEETFTPVNGSNPIPVFYGYPVSNLTFEMFRRILKLDDPLIIPDGWSVENEIEFAQKVIHDRCKIWDYNCQDTYENWTTIPKISRMHFCENSLFPNGNYTALVIGNSHSDCGAGAIYLNPLFRKVITMSAYGIRIPSESNADSDTLLANAAMLQVLEKFKPDVVFSLNFYKGEIVDVPVVEPIYEDYGFRALDKLVKHISKFTKAIIINHLNLVYKFPITPEYIRLKHEEKSIDFTVRKQTIGPLAEENQNLKKRFDALDCPKCYFWDYSEAFCGDNYCNPIDENTKLPLIRDEHHVGILTQRRFKPILDKVVKRALNITNIDDCVK